MIITYLFKAGATRINMALDIARLICGAKMQDLSVAAAGVTFDGAAVAAWSYVSDDSSGAVVKRAGIAGDLLIKVTAAGANIIYPLALCAAGAAGEWSPPAIFFGDASANPVSAGYLKIYVNDKAFMVTAAVANVRLGAIAAEIDGDLIGAGYSRSVVLSLTQYGSSGQTATKALPQAMRIKNNAAAGDKVGVAAATFAVLANHPVLGSVASAAELPVYQLLPVDLWSNPRAANYGYMSGVMLVPGANIATDDWVMCGADRYAVMRDMSVAIGSSALALAIKA